MFYSFCVFAEIESPQNLFCPELSNLKFKMWMKQAETDSKVTLLVKVTGDVDAEVIVSWP